MLQRNEAKVTTINITEQKVLETLPEDVEFGIIIPGEIHGLSTSNCAADQPISIELIM